MKTGPNKIHAILKVKVVGEFYDDDASEETLRYAVEQDLEDAGFEVDVSIINSNSNQDKDLFLIEAVKAIKAHKSFNQFLEEQKSLINLLDYSEIEAREVWNDAWFSVEMTMKVKEKILNNMEDKK